MQCPKCRGGWVCYRLKGLPAKINKKTNEIFWEERFYCDRCDNTFHISQTATMTEGRDK